MARRHGGSEPKSNIAVDAVLNNKVRVTKVHSNFDQEIIVVTEDKVRLCLKDKIDAIKKRQGWHTPGGVLLTIILAATTSKFQDFATLPADVWRGIFLAGGAFTTVWFAVSVIRSLRRQPSVDDILIELKRETPKVDMDAIRFILRDGVLVNEIERSTTSAVHLSVSDEGEGPANSPASSA